MTEQEFRKKIQVLQCNLTDVRENIQKTYRDLLISHAEEKVILHDNHHFIRIVGYVRLGTFPGQFFVEFSSTDEQTCRVDFDYMQIKYVSFMAWIEVTL